MSTPNPTTQPASPSPPSLTHQGLSNGVAPLTNHVHLTTSTVSITPSHLPRFGTASTTPQTPLPLRRPSSSTPTITGQQHPQRRALAGTPTAASFATRLGELDDPTATYMRELIEGVEAARVGGEGLRGGGRGDSV